MMIFQSSTFNGSMARSRIQLRKLSYPMILCLLVAGTLFLSSIRDITWLFGLTARKDRMLSIQNSTLGACPNVSFLVLF